MTLRVVRFVTYYTLHAGSAAAWEKDGSTPLTSMQVTATLMIMVAERDNSRFSILNSRFSILNFIFSILDFSLTEFSILNFSLAQFSI